jgi:hypothetical protein
MTTATLVELIKRHGFDVLEHLDRDAQIPVHSGLQAQGDLLIIPVQDPPLPAGKDKGSLVPAEGIAVIKSVGGGHEHRLFAAAPGTVHIYLYSGASTRIAYIEVTEPAFIAHPEHDWIGIAPGAYLLRRQRELAEEERRVAD